MSTKGLIGFEHKGTKIDMKDNGEFVALVGGKEITAPSVQALKKKLDRIDPFKPFEGFSVDYDGGIEMLEVIGVKKHRRYNSYNWITKSGRERGHVYLATKENLAIAKRLQAERKKFEKIEKAHEALKRELTDSLVQAPFPGEIRES